MKDGSHFLLNNRNRLIVLLFSALVVIYMVFGPFFGAGAVAASDKPEGPTAEECLMCHSDSGLTTEREGREVSLHVPPEEYKNSLHGGMECIECHYDHTSEDFVHPGYVEDVDCEKCHEEQARIYAGSLHGKAVREGEELAPRCRDCHEPHNTLDAQNPASHVNKFNIPYVCGRCHKEGTEVNKRYDIPKEQILTHYSLSIHGEGLFRKGLTVSAVCTDCHTSHNTRSHTDPESSIHKDNVPGTCQKCHGLIERVHRKVIRGELWEKEPDKVPVCIDCHSPHEIRKVYYELGMSDKDCMVCHSRPDLTGEKDGKTVSMTVDNDVLKHSAHENVACAKCHTDLSIEHERPCYTTPEKVDCSICHAEVVETYNTSMHGKLYNRGDPNAPACEDCHGTHEVMAKKNPDSPIYPRNVPELCSKCHREGKPAAKRYKGDQKDIVKSYVMSIHGKGLLESGLVVTATCADCHTAHHVLPADNPESSVHSENVDETCAQCHSGIYNKFKESIHSDAVADTDESLPMCNDCHSSHTISRTDMRGFKLDITRQCGRCHEKVTETYFQTYHGKVSKLGFTGVAKCYDCHGAHYILPTDNPESMVSRQNIVDTCAKCHPDAHQRFAGYLTHATHHDRDKYPILFYTFWLMTSLLIGTFAFFGVHTVLWLPRSFQAMRRRKKLEEKAASGQERQFSRFKPLHRRLHIFMIIAFIGLALTGMTLKFSYLEWARWLSHLLGGYESAGYIHRICAVLMFFIFGIHLVDMLRTKKREGKSWKEYLTDPESMMPNKDDVKDFIATFKWFIGLGPRPEYGRWTYWEKFDYFAVFWGIAIIGFTGLFLWFPEFFTHIFPGWFINVATIIHSDEALLAVGFIFTVHFFNTHFRPDKFPMDPIIFSGTVPLEELKEDRPRWYKKLVESGELKENMAEPLPEVVVRGMKIFGGVALSIGIILILLIIWAEVFGYR